MQFLVTNGETAFSLSLSSHLRVPFKLYFETIVRVMEPSGGYN